MKPKDFANAFMKRLKLIAVITILPTVAALIFSYIQSPVYVAEATCLVSSTVKGTDEYAAIQVIDRLLKTINEIAVSKPVLDDAGKRLAGRPSIKQLRDSVLSEVLIDTQIVTISAKDQKPKEAMLKANAVARSLVAFINNRMGKDGIYKIEMLEPATIPRSPISPRPIRNAVIGFIVGLLLGVATTILLESR